MRFLIIKPSSLGDIVHTFPAAALLRSTIPEAEIDWVANDTLAQIVSLFPNLHRVIHFPRQRLSLRHPGIIRDFIRDLQRDEYDAVIDFQGLLRSGLMAHFARTAIRFGFANGRECSPFFYSRRVSLPTSLHHAADKNLFLMRTALTGLGFCPPVATPEAQLELPAAWCAAADALLQKHAVAPGATIVAVGCSSRWESKSWPVPFFAETIRRAAAANPRLVFWLLGGVGERARCEAVQQAARTPQLINLAGETDLGSLAALLRRSSVMFTNDSGPMHIAAALGVPCVACFGSTSAALTGPYGPPGRHFILQSQCPQAPCLKRRCPRGKACPDGVTPQEAAEAIAARLTASAT